MASASTSVFSAVKNLFRPRTAALPVSNSATPGYMYFANPALPDSECSRDTSTAIRSKRTAPYDHIPKALLLDHAMESIWKTYALVPHNRHEFSREVFPLFVTAAVVYNSLPASQQTHHAYPGGLFIHCCEVAHRAIKRSHSVKLPPSYLSSQHDPENKKLWSLVIIAFALFHDIVKLSTDMDIVHPDANDLFLRLRKSQSSSKGPKDHTHTAEQPITATSQRAIDEEKKRQQGHLFFSPLSDNFLEDWLLTFPEGSRSYFLHYRHNRGNSHDYRPDFFAAAMERVFRRTRLNRIHPSYLDAIRDPDSKAYKIIRYEIVHPSDQESAAETRSIHNAPTAMLVALIKEAVALGLLTPSNEFPLKIKDRNILVCTRTGYETIDQKISTLQGYSILGIKPNSTNATKRARYRELLANAKCIECDASGNPIDRTKEHSYVWVLTPSFSSELIALSSTKQTRSDVRSIADTPSSVNSTPADPPSTSPPTSSAIDISANADPVESPPPHFDSPPDLPNREAASSAPSFTVFQSGLFTPQVDHFLSYLADRIGEHPPEELSIADWQSLNPDEQDAFPYIIQPQEPLYLFPSVVLEYCKANGLLFADFFVQLKEPGTIIQNLHFSEVTGRLSHIELTQRATGGVIVPNLLEFFSLLHEDRASNDKPSSGAEPSLPESSSYTPAFVCFIEFLATSPGIHDPERAPYQLDNPPRIHIKPKQRDAFLDHDKKRPRKEYGLTKTNWTDIFDISGIRRTKVGDAIEIPGSVDYYIEKLNAC